MKRLHARDLLDMDLDTLWAMPVEVFELVFDDGSIITNTRRTIYSWFHWEVHRQWSQTPLRMRHHMQRTEFSGKTTLDILSHLAEDVHYSYNADYDREELWKLFYQISNTLYNTGIVRCAAYRTTSDVLSFLEIWDDPEVQQANASLKPTPLSVDACYKVIGNVIAKKASLSHNPVARGVRAGIINLQQALQIFGPRGRLTEVDSQVYEEPILRGYFQGIVRLRDHMVESRMATKALMFTKAPLRAVEYFNRKMQLIASNIHTLAYHDCHSPEYMEVKLTPGLLSGMEGMYYRTDQGLKALRLSDKALIGQTLQFRAPHLCGHRHEQTVCHVCLGLLAYSVPYDTNIGHVASTEMCREGSQLVLSIKHLETSALAAEIELSERDALFLRNGIEQGALLLTPNLSATRGYLVLEVGTSQGPILGAAAFAGLAQHTDLQALSIQRLTSFKDVCIGYHDREDNRVEEYVSVHQAGCLGSLTHEFLAYVLEVGYSVRDDGRYQVDLSQWNFDQPVFKLPLRNLNTLDYMSRIEAFIRSPQETSKDIYVGETRKLIDYTSADEALLDLYELTSAKLRVHLAHLSVMLVAMMRSGDDPDDYSIPPLGRPMAFERHSKLMEMQSLGKTLVYEHQPAVMDNVDSYLLKDRMPHNQDPLFL